MKQFVLILFISLVAVACTKIQSSAHNEPSSCPDCHEKEAVEYARTSMAQAARTPGFLHEWENNEKDEHCLDCHSPGRQQGVTCIDCHGDKGHPYTLLKLPGVCAQCHDAPGELTVRSYNDSPAAKRGQDCVDCHQHGDSSSHDFRGPSRSDFLAGVARLRIALRRDNEGITAIIGVSHRAGHALPGGTTGRSVWLVVDELDNKNRSLRQALFRFGWLHNPETGWEDYTLPPGAGRVIEIPLANHNKAVILRAKLVYRFVPGNLSKPDPQEVVLDEVEYALTFNSMKPE